MAGERHTGRVPHRSSEVAQGVEVEVALDVVPIQTRASEKPQPIPITRPAVMPGVPTLCLDTQRQCRHHRSMPVDPDTTDRIIRAMPKSLISEVDEYRITNQLPSRAEAIRRILRIALALEPQAIEADE